jgi:hypothetical protein
MGDPAHSLDPDPSTYIAFLSEEFPVTVAGGVRLVPDPPPDNSPEAVRKRTEWLRAEYARQGIPFDGPVTPVSDEEWQATLRELGLE